MYHLKDYTLIVTSQIDYLSFNNLKQGRPDLMFMFRFPSDFRLTETSDSTSLASQVDDKVVHGGRRTSIWKEVIHELSPVWVFRIWEWNERHVDRWCRREVKCEDDGLG